MSGLRPDVDLADPWVGREAAVNLANEEVLSAAPGRQFVYSDIGFFLLAEIVAKVSGQPFEQFVSARLFRPLGMNDTMFLPPANLRARIAPTEVCTPYGWPCAGPGAEILRGTVHDPTARRMGGVAGHAGLFSTADDTARFARMLLRGGELDGVRVLSPLTVARMTSPSTPEGLSSVRGLGWDIDSAFSSNRGELLPVGSFGHTGFTGTSIWVDPVTQVFVVFMSNRVHPDGKGDVTPVRARVATIAASAFTTLPASGLSGTRRTFDTQTPAVPAPAHSPVQNGIDVLRAGGFAPLKGLRVGLLTNHTGRTRDGAATIDVLADVPGVTLVSLLSPEHGIRGILDAAVPSTRDDRTGLPIHSLYGETRRPTAAMLTGLDAIVIDLQDVGARFYTYMTTMAYVMEEAAPRKVKVFVLDRPNPIGGVSIEGPSLDQEAVSFIGYLPTATPPSAAASPSTPTAVSSLAATPAAPPASPWCTRSSPSCAARPVPGR
jgi:CubicO group peptidase (beta-lactamase class C family)